LLNYSIKSIAKLLSTRLQTLLPSLIHENQYGFIKGRTIQDCLAWAFQFLHICHHSKKKIVILKLDFEKAFDKIEHPFIVEVMKQRGFSSKWINWVKSILGTASSVVLLNGIPGKSFTCKRGVRQGDPLSPLLFVLAVDFLQTVVNKAWQLGVLKHPLSDDFGGDFPIVQYADDTLLILPADALTLFKFKGILRSFSDSSGLKVNFQKFSLVPINMNDEEALHLANTFGCKVGTMPFTYLGLPLGTTKPSIQDFSPLICRIERRLSGISKMLSYQGRLILVNSVFLALPTFYMCSLQIPPGIIEQIDKYRKHCLWSGGDINRKGTCLAAWEYACKSKDNGGLGIIDLKAQNSALLLKHLDKFYNHANIPWVNLTWSKFYKNNYIPPHAKSPSGSFWWKDLLKLAKDFRKMATCKPAKGTSVMLWQDLWSDELISNKFPELFSFARKPKCSIRFFLDKDPATVFFYPLSPQASIQLDSLLALTQSSDWDVDTEDSWSYSWGNSSFSSKKAYKFLVGQQEASPLFKWMWTAGNLGKHKFFFWLLLMDRLNTRNILRRKNQHLDDFNCVLCNMGSEETCFHLFFSCPFSTSCWSSLNITWDTSQ
jgi:hypothetical protein